MAAAAAGRKSMREGSRKSMRKSRFSTVQRRSCDTAFEHLKVNVRRSGYELHQCGTSDADK
jgi:hypothetical protein